LGHVLFDIAVLFIPMRVFVQLSYVLLCGYQVVGFDMVDDESKPERRPTKHMQPPAKWDNPFNPAYSYWAYYVYANLYTLNKVWSA
jgi:adenosine deaminase